MRNEKKAAALTNSLVDLYSEALKQLKSQTPCSECGQKTFNASLMREVREFLKQHDISLDQKAPELQDLEGIANAVPFPVRNSK